MSTDSMKFLIMRMREFDPSTIGPKLKNAFTSGAAYVRTGVSNIISSLGRGLKSAWAFSAGMVKSTVRWSGEVLRATLSVGKGLAQLGWQFLKTTGNVALYGAKMIWAGVQATGQLIKGVALTIIGLLRQGAAFVASRIAMLAGAAATYIMTASQWALNVAMSANPIGLIIMGVVALIGVIILLVKNWDKVGGAVKSGVGGIWNALKAFAGAITGIFASIGGAIKGFFTGIWDSIKGAIFGFVNFFIDKINWMSGVANKIPGVNIPLIPRLEISKPPEMKSVELGVELKEFTKSENLISASPWTIKTADAEVGVEAKQPKLPLMKAIIEPIFVAIPIITVFAKAILLTPLEALFGGVPEVALAGSFVAPGPVGGGAGIVPPPYGGESYITNAPATHTATSSSRTVVDRHVGTVHFHIQSSDGKSVVREIEKYLEQLASQGDAIDGVEIA